jgi:hypothetical protein
LSQPLTRGKAATDGAGGRGAAAAGSEEARGTLRRPTKKAPTESPENPFPVPISSLVPGANFFGGVGILTASSHPCAVVIPLRTLAKHSKRFTPLLAAPAALLLGQEQAKAVLTYNIFESAGNVVVQTSGSLNLPLTSIGSADCRSDGGLLSFIAIICTGPQGNLALYGITGSPSFNGVVFEGGGSSVSATSTFLVGGSNPVNPGGFSISFGYISGSPIVSTSTFTGQTLSSLGFTINSGLLGSWTLDGTGDTIQAFLGPPAAAVPGPLPLLGAGVAFGWSRRLRKRIAAPLSTPPQA